MFSGFSILNLIIYINMGACYYKLLLSYSEFTSVLLIDLLMLF